MADHLPLIGKQVIYFTDIDIDPPHNGAKALPAVITKVIDKDLVNLKVINDGDVDFWKTTRRHGQGVGNWEWPDNLDLYHLSNMLKGK